MSTIASVQETNNPLIPESYNIAWSIGVVLFLAALAVAVWLLLRTLKKRNRHD